MNIRSRRLPLLALFVAAGTVYGQYSILPARGSNQVAGINSLANPFVAYVTDSNGHAAPGVTVTFNANPNSGYFLLPSGTQTQSASATSDLQGLVEAPQFFTIGFAGQFLIQATSGNSTGQFILIVTQKIGTLLFASPANSCFLGETVTLQLTLNPNPGGGKVAFYDGTYLLGYGQVVAGVATLRTILPSAGTRHLVARYVGTPFTPYSSPAQITYNVQALPVKAFGPASWTTAATPSALVTADFNLDGKLDIAVASGNTVQFYWGNGDGTMRTGSSLVLTGASTITNLWAIDTNVDGYVDLVASDGVKAAYIAQNDGAGNFSLQYTSGTSAAPNPTLVFADFDRDGIVDFVNFGGVTYYGFVNDSWGAIGTPPSSFTLFPTIGPAIAADINDDGILDLIQANSGGVTFYQGTGSGRFVAGQSFSVPAQLLVADDINGDGFYKIASALPGGNTIAEIYDAPAGYAASTFILPAGGVNSLNWVDLNGDGILDLMVQTTLPGGSNQAYVLYGKTDGTLQNPVTMGSGGNVAAFADFNGDGIPDMVLGTSSTVSIQPGGSGGPLAVYNGTSNNTLPNGTLNVAYSTQITGAGGVRPYSFQITAGQQPNGLKLTVNRLGSGAYLAGTPTVAGNFTFTVTITDATSHSATANFSLAVINSPVNIPLQVMPGGVVGTSYQYSIVFTGGSAPFTFSYPGAAAIPGLSLNSNGTITGIPQQAGSYTIPVLVTDAANQTATQSITLFVTQTNPSAAGRNLGLFRAGRWYIDVNGDHLWTPGTDLSFIFGQQDDIPVLGDWTNTGVQRYGVFHNGTWWLDLNGDRTWTADQDIVFTFGQPGDYPIVGDWDNSGHQRIGVFRGGVWFLDMNGDHQFTPGVDVSFIFGQPGDIPIIGDWTNSGVQRIGVFRNGQWFMDINNDRNWTLPEDRLVSYGMIGDYPVIGDWDGSGITRIGVFRNGQWWLDMNNDYRWRLPDDQLVLFGQTGDVPVLKRAPF